MSDLIEALEFARSVQKAKWHGIGEPAVRLDPTSLLISSDDPMLVHMRMSDLIALVRAALAAAEPRP